MDVTKCCALTNYRNDDKDELYERLQSIIAKCSGKKLTNLLGGINAKIGMENNVYRDIMERHGLGEKARL